MLHFLPFWILEIINIILLVFFTSLVSTLICIVAVIRIISCGFGHKLFIKTANFIMRCWLYSIKFTMWLTNDIKWSKNIAIKPEFNDSYVLVSNHLSWLDTLVVAAIFSNLRPVPKFFLKHSLLYVPFVGGACWGLDMPFLRRYPKSYLLKHPEMRFKDIETARQACEKFSGVPTMMAIFPEGTRYTKEKAEAANSTYEHLMQPKPTSIAVAIESLGMQFTKIIDLTICYPKNQNSPFHDFLKGKISNICIDIEEYPITEDLRGSYMTDKPFKRHFSSWLQNIWKNKDAKIGKMIEAESE